VHRIMVVVFIALLLFINVSYGIVYYVAVGDASGAELRPLIGVYGSPSRS